MALWILSGTTRVSRYQKKHLPTHTYHGHQSSFICFLHLLRSVASSLFNLHTWQSFRTVSLQVFFGLPLGLAPSTYSIHFFTQSLSSFHSTCPCHCNLFCCSTEMISSNPRLLVSLVTLYLELLSFSLMPHIHLTILVCVCWSAISFSFVTGHVWLPCSILLHTQLLYSFPLTINDTNCLNLFHPPALVRTHWIALDWIGFDSIGLDWIVNRLMLLWH